MTLGKDPNKLRAHLYVHQYGSPAVWVPYKTLIGYGRGHHLIIDDIGEHIYETREFGTLDAAVEYARAEAKKEFRKNFPMSLCTRSNGNPLKNRRRKVRAGSEEEFFKHLPRTTNCSRFNTIRLPQPTTAYPVKRQANQNTKPLGLQEDFRTFGVERPGPEFFAFLAA